MKFFSSQDFIRNSALLQRNLTLSSKSISLYFVRCLLPGFLIYIIWIAGNELSGNNLGQVSMTIISYFNIAVISLGALLRFCPAISSEREKGTLTLLKLTPLNPLSILLGKLAGPYVNLLFYMLLQVPFVLVSVMLGGVSTLQILQLYFIQIVYMTSLAAIALFCSVRNPESWMAGFNFIIMVGGSYMINAALYWFGFRDETSKAMANFLAENSTLLLCANILSPTGASILNHFILNACITIIFGYLAYRFYNSYDQVEIVKHPEVDAKTLTSKSRKISGLPVATKDRLFTFGGKPSQAIVFGAMISTIIFSIITEPNTKYYPRTYKVVLKSSFLCK